MSVQHKRLQQQVDQLRAELAAAKERCDGLYLGLRQTLEALGGVAQPGVSEAFLILGVPGEAAALKRVNNTLAADNARLRKALQPFADRIKAYPPWMWTAMIEREKEGIITGGFTVGNEAVTHMPAMLLVQAEEALAATPAQSLAAHDAAVKVAVLREVAETCKFRLNGGEWRICPETLISEADRIEKEAQRG